MIILITILVICAVIIAIISDNCDQIEINFFAVGGAILLGFLDMILIIICICYGFKTMTIEDTINMYQEENTKIETQITTIVQSYQGYEKEVVSNIADMEVMLIKLPELKTSELAKSQMSLYIENNNQIKSLKTQKIETKIAKWLLYFGK